MPSILDLDASTDDSTVLDQAARALRYGPKIVRVRVQSADHAAALRTELNVRGAPTRRLVTTWKAPT